ncbi:MAG: hypothetical protein ACRCYU_20700 [Nocardioides sp.]
MRILRHLGLGVGTKRRNFVRCFQHLMALAKAWLRVPTLLAVLAVSACSAASPERVGPTGVDELTIPMPRPRAVDFVTEVDNPYLPLKPGTVWHYRTSATTAESRTRTVRVTDEVKLVAQIPVTVVHDVVRDQTGDIVTDDYLWFAQDRRGNVWTFGQRGVWQVGVAGGQAGLAMPATPRTGDGYRRELLPGIAEDQAVVLAIDGTAVVESGSFDNLVVIEDTTRLEPGLVQRNHYARGVGLVLGESRGRPDVRFELVGFVSP